MAYSLFKGVRLGYLPDSYAQYAEKAINGICDKSILIQAQATTSSGGICLVEVLAARTEDRGTYEYYMSEPIVEDDAKGVGPFLLAYTELLRYKNKNN